MIVSVMSRVTPQSKLRQIFRIFDTDNNGVISVDELNNIVEHLFHLVPEGQKERLKTPASVRIYLKLLVYMEKADFLKYL